MTERGEPRDIDGLPDPTSAAQFEAWRTRGIPPVEEVRPGVWSVPLPLPDGNPVYYVNCYVLQGSSGVVVVDPAWDHAPGLVALERGLAQTGAALGDVDTVVVTHFHPDHYGLAPTVRERSGAKVLMHDRDSAIIGNRATGIDDAVGTIAGFLRRSGAPQDEMSGLADERGLVAKMRAMAGPDGVLEDEATLGLDGLEVRAVWTPGHTPGHLCLFLPDTGLLLTGDHVLPRISPNVSAYSHDADNPLTAYLASLAALRRLAVHEVLPGHEYRFAALGERLDELLAHHEERLHEVLRVLDADGAATSWQVARQLPWSRDWSQMPGYARRAAHGEILAHLMELQTRCEATRFDDDAYLWRPVR